MIILGDLGYVNTETGEIVGGFDSIDYLYNGQGVCQYETVNLNNSYDIYLTQMRYTKGFSGLHKIHNQSNSRLLSKKYYHKHKDEILVKRKVYYKENRKLLIFRQLKYAKKHSEYLSTKIICECGRSVSNRNISAHKKSKIHLKGIL